MEAMGVRHALLKIRLGEAESDDLIRCGAQRAGLDLTRGVLSDRDLLADVQP